MAKTSGRCGRHALTHLGKLGETRSDQSPTRSHSTLCPCNEQTPTLARSAASLCSVVLMVHLRVGKSRTESRCVEPDRHLCGGEQVSNRRERSGRKMFKHILIRLERFVVQ
jgi:hypothetical protein